MAVVKFASILEPTNATHTIHAAGPHPLLTPVVANGIANDSSALAAQLAYLASIGGGRLDCRMPGRTIKCNSGLTIPNGGKWAGELAYDGTDWWVTDGAGS